VIDAIDLILVPMGEQPAIECDGRRQVVTEWLLNNEAPPAGAIAKSFDVQMLAEDSGKFRRRRTVEKEIMIGAMPLFDLGRKFGEPAVRRMVVELALHIIKAGDQFIALAGVNRLSCRELLKIGHHARAELGRRPLVLRKSKDREPIRQEPVALQVVKRRDQKPARQVSGSSAKNKGAGIGSYGVDVAVR
jgi:hypothetical protein